MNQTVVIPEQLYIRLEDSARQRGVQSIQRLLELWQLQEEEQRKRKRVVQEIHKLRERLFHSYGVMTDSTLILQEDRAR
jgi:protein-arginine kinase